MWSRREARVSGKSHCIAKGREMKTMRNELEASPPVDTPQGGLSYSPRPTHST